MTDQLLRIKAWDSDLEEEPSNGTAERGAKNGREDKVDKQGHLQKVQKLIYAAKVFLLLRNMMSCCNLADFQSLIEKYCDCACVQLNADLKSVDEDKDRVFAKLNDEVKAKEDLLGE